MTYLCHTHLVYVVVVMYNVFVLSERREGGVFCLFGFGFRSYCGQLKFASLFVVPFHFFFDFDKFSSSFSSLRAKQVFYIPHTLFLFEEKMPPLEVLFLFVYLLGSVDVLLHISFFFFFFPFFANLIFLKFFFFFSPRTIFPHQTNQPCQKEHTHTQNSQKYRKNNNFGLKTLQIN